LVTATRRRCSSCGRSPPSKVERREVEQSQHAGAGMADHSSGDREVVVVVKMRAATDFRTGILEHAKDFGIAFPKSNECFHRT
jgi:hypothetical protein